MCYDNDDIQQAVQLAILGGGSLAGTLVTADPQVAQSVIRMSARAHSTDADFK